MHACITGGTGFVGAALTGFLTGRGHTVTIFTRNPDKYTGKEQAKGISYASYDDLPAVVGKSAVVINLAGENLFDQRWTDSVKSRILKSRVKITRSVVEAIVAASEKPELLISASAVGFYGSRGDLELDEGAGSGDDFLSRVCLQWEEEAAEVRTTGVRLAIPRIGIVLEKDGGALSKMLPPFNMFVGGPLGSGKHYFPWVHMNDVCRAFLFAIEEEKLEGPFNVSSPNPVTMKKFASELGHALGRPSVFPVPEFALRMLLGEATDALIASQRTIPARLKDLGFSFNYPEAGMALKQILSNKD